VIDFVGTHAEPRKQARTVAITRQECVDGAPDERFERVLRRARLRADGDELARNLLTFGAIMRRQQEMVQQRQCFGCRI